MKITTISSISEYIEIIKQLNNKSLWYRGVANKNYFPIPSLIWKNLQMIEGSLEHDFLVSYKSYIDQYNLDKWEVLALMQHHGLPTRLLDWTESALVALYFAITSEPESNEDRAIWILNPYKLNEQTIGAASLYCPSIINDNIIRYGNQGKTFDIDTYLPPNLKKTSTGPVPEQPIAIKTTHVIKRVSAQKGCFTMHGYNNQSIDKYIKNENDFQMIIIKIGTKEDRINMIGLLSMLGIDEEFIYQDLDSLCNRIKRGNNII